LWNSNFSNEVTYIGFDVKSCKFDSIDSNGDNIILTNEKIDSRIIEVFNITEIDLGNEYGIYSIGVIKSQ